jgi:hypothetical protein
MGRSLRENKARNGMLPRIEELARDMIRQPGASAKDYRN